MSAAGWKFIKTLSANVPLQGALRGTGDVEKVFRQKRENYEEEKGFNTLYCFICLIPLWTRHGTGIIESPLSSM